MFGIDDAMTALAVANLASGVLGSGAATTAAGQQAGAAIQASQFGQNAINTIATQNAPYQGTGAGAATLLGGYLGIPGYTTGPVNYKGQQFSSKDAVKQALISDYQNQTGRSPEPNVMAQIENYVAQATPVGSPNDASLIQPFTSADLVKNLAPNYQFALDWGLRGVQNQSNSLNSLLSGNTGKGLIDYATNYAQNAGQQAFNNWFNNQQRIFQNLSTVAGQGLQSNQINAGVTGAVVPSVAGAIQGAGAAQAAGTVGSTNAITGGLTNAATMFALPSILRGPGGVGSAGGGIDPSMFAG